ncbi:hypothetical protein O7634_07585 [Micromonospora sp. WMMD1120]|uniref:hypothetical protein n=1 Tax=Micromonospora sp. WMMD1120 TaxID=3016106 RepID=UPI002416620B|nr:hypothetical protein [Micromonospora sp. WMMD1120]MDG4806617.1 hypothetical protein [Micromonospora sp. WMMD1120]
MPAPATPDVRRQPPLLTMLFWAGVGLAPVAALILLVADGNGPLRFAAVLAILAVVLIGLSIALRPDGEGDAARADELLDEIEGLRRELRSEIVAAAQRGNQALDQAQRAQEGVAALSRRLDASSAALAGAASADPPGAGRARVPAEPPTDDAPVARSRVSAPVDAPAGRARVSGPGPDEASRWGRSGNEDDDEPAYAWEAAEQSAPAGTYGAGRPAGTAYGAARPESAHRPGVVRHTETVHVTTRHTVVDGGTPEPAGHYGGRYTGQWTPPAQEWTRGGGAEERPRAGYGDDRPAGGYGDDRAGAGDDRARGAQQATRGGQSEWSAARDGSGRDPRYGADEPEWTDPRDAYAQPDERGSTARSPRPPERSWDGPDDRGWSERRDRAGASAPQAGPPLRADDTGEYWSQLRAGDRWAAVRDDENGHEMRVGERRAEVHADASGTEYRVADRWATVRHEEPRRHEDDGRYEGGGRYGERESYRDEPAGRPALPRGGVPVPDEWRPPRQRGQAEPAPDRVGRRRVEERYGYPPRDDAPRAGGASPTDRWR